MKKINKKIVMIILLLFLIILLVWTIFNFGYIKYYFDKTFLPSEKLIEKYAEIILPDDVIVESLNFEKDIDGDILTEVLEAKIIVKEEYADNLFKDIMYKDFDYSHGFSKIYGVSEDEFDFNIFRPSRVDTGLTSTQRSIYYFVLKSFNGNTTIYVFVDKLGWTKQ